MNKDFDTIIEALKKRFPLCSITSDNGSGIGDSHTNLCMFVLYLETVDIGVWAGCLHNATDVEMGYIEHYKSDYFKEVGNHLFDFEYQNPEHLVGKFVEGCEVILKERRAFEQEENEALAQFNMKRPSIDPEISPDLEKEINGHRQ